MTPRRVLAYAPSRTTPSVTRIHPTFRFRRLSVPPMLSRPYAAAIPARSQPRLRIPMSVCMATKIRLRLQGLKPRSSCWPRSTLMREPKILAFVKFL